MAYNTRRGSGGGYMSGSASSVGQRRGNNPQQQQLGNNFVAGGQLNQPVKPLLQMGQQTPNQRQQAPPQQKQPAPQAAAQRQQQNLRQQAQQFLAQQPKQPQPLMQQAVGQPQPQPTPKQPEVAVDPPQQPNVELKVEDKSMDNGTDGAESEDGSDRRSKKNKPFWMRKDGKINKKERLRRRNQRLRKILQPKNALMVLNELIGSAPYNMSENADLYEGTVFKCTVLVDGLEHVGVGKSKPSAKTAAAEAALKHMVLSKLKTVQSLEPNSLPAAAAAVAAAVTPAAEPSSAAEGAAVVGDGDIKMEIDAEDNLGGISWSHVACYALHKLLSSWDEGSNLAEKLARAVVAGAMPGGAVTISESLETRSTNADFKPLLQLAQAASGGSITTSDKAKTFEKKPAKKLPESAANMNPIMLLNQMHPNAVYEEVCKTGHTPNVQFTVKCTVNGEPFIGRGTTKKGARKICAFAACKKVLGIEYDAAFLEQHGFSEDAVGFANPAPAPMVVE